MFFFGGGGWGIIARFTRQNKASSKVKSPETLVERCVEKSMKTLTTSFSSVVSHDLYDSHQPTVENYTSTTPHDKESMTKQFALIWRTI